MAKCSNYDGYQATDLNEAVNHVMDNLLTNTTKDGTRSVSKTATIHEFIGRHVQELFLEKYNLQVEVHTQIHPDGEYELENDIGEHHNCDVAILTPDYKHLLHVFEVKWLLRSYSKNAANYKKNMRGETALIHWTPGRPNVSQIFLAMDWMPNISKSKISGWESMKYDDYKLMLTKHAGSDNVPDSFFGGVLEHTKNPRKPDYKTYSDYQNGYVESKCKLRLCKSTYRSGHFFLNDFDGFIDDSVDMIYEKLCEIDEGSYIS